MATDQQRLDRLEGDVMDLKTRLAVAESSINEIKDKLNKIENNTNKTVWLIVSVIILAVLNTIIDGGIVGL